MAFPNYKTKKFLKIFVCKEPDEWEQLGGQGYGGASYHNLCTTRAAIGKEKGVPFLYCPLCMVKLNPNQTT
jgi:hypothetical protein